MMINERNADPQPKKDSETPDPINKPEEVPESNDEKIDQDFPGYPHYPAKDDILNPENNTERVDVDLENVNRSTGSIRLQEKDIERKNQAQSISEEEEDDLGIVEGTEADVTEDDLLILQASDGVIGPNREEDLNTTDSRADINAVDLDIPGTELDDDNEAIGEEDEENNYYSLGADLEDLLEDGK